MTHTHPLMRSSLLAAALLAAFAAHAQQAPDAGRTLQETAPRTLEAPRLAPRLDLAPPQEAAVLPGGPSVTLTRITITGNTVFTEAELLALLGDYRGRSYDLAGLKALARRITEHYRAQGYPFARAVLKAQKIEGGVLAIEIIEGRYGKVEAQGEMAEEAQAFLEALKPGEVISAAPLERATLILSDQPGIRVRPLLRPGQEVGAGDLIVEVGREPTLKGEVGLDNHGNRFSGQNRLRANVQADSPFLLGDQIKAQALVSDEGLWQGSLGYSLPLGASGLRGGLSYAHTYYELGKDFKNLKARGTADVAGLNLAYPLIRSQAANLILVAGYQHKALEDRQDATSTRNDKSSDLAPLALQFNRRDGSGLTYGTLAYTAGQLDLDAVLEAADIASGRDTRGHFDKWNLDLARLQTTPLSNLTLFGRLSAQWAGKNLDSSERFLLGGATGVRAYPQGEGLGDEGWLLQLEARYRLGAFEPYLFYDAGAVRVNAKPDGITPAVADNHRLISGAGLGLRLASGPWNLDAAIAWRNQGGQPQSDSQDHNPRAWLAASWRF
ncbi:ShlB/FhaC/HecB family hemolysin secretion/activation protein [Caldichromatium japonicum]|uniref:ShlB/FhaC/HecB family hemolysin secretion/activation protein n=2 Tax=Caldichromatium japonicum TaxID=2699430 RepID=A0A6G7VGZ8_9GAMM|nr:ShlB/FhaC/HecB family hemolysin secretion/activation protein [Caldichromatium japonicum]